MNEDEKLKLTQECFNELVDFINPRKNKYPPIVMIYTLVELSTEIAYMSRKESVAEVKKDLKEIIDCQMECAVIKYQEKGKK